MDRRDVLKYTAYLTGYAVTAPLTSAILSGCKSEPATAEVTTKFFSAEEFPSIEAMINTMLPKTDTPGAVELGVPSFVDIVLADYTEEEDQQKLQKGLSAWLSEVSNAKGSSYAELSAEDQLRLLNELDASSKKAAEELDDLDLDKEEKEDRAPWWFDLKSMVIGGYYSSEYIGTEVLVYDPVPGAYQGCISLSDMGGKNWSL